MTIHKFTLRLTGDRLAFTSLPTGGRDEAFKVFRREMLAACGEATCRLEPAGVYLDFRCGADSADAAISSALDTVRALDGLYAELETGGG